MIDVLEQLMWSRPREFSTRTTRDLLAVNTSDLNIVLQHRSHVLSKIISQRIAYGTDRTVSTYASDILRRTQKHKLVTSSTVTFDFDSNDSFICIDCMPFCNAKKKEIHIALKSICAQKDVTGKKHTVILLNIHFLPSLSLHGIKNTVEAYNHNVRLICTTCKHIPTDARLGALQISLTFNEKDIARAIVDATNIYTVHDESFLNRIWNVSEHDVVNVVLLLAGPDPTYYSNPLYQYLNKSVLNLIWAPPSPHVYTIVNEITTMIVSTCIPYQTAARHVIKIFESIRPSIVTDIIDILAQSEATLLYSNKVSFVMEQVFLKIYNLAHNKR